MGKHKEYNIYEMQKLAAQKGGRCVSSVYYALRLKLEWECAEGHQFSIEPSKILDRGYWCPQCTNRRHKQTIEAMKKLAEKRGWEFLSDEFKGVMVKHKWRCEKGHEFMKLPNSVQKGSGCRICAGKGLLDIDIFKKIAEEKRGKCLSEKYVNRWTKLLFECDKGHQWFAIPGEIKNGNTWCRKCAGLERGTLEEMKELAKSKGGICLSKKYVNSATKLEWQCADSHTWRATPRDVKHSDSWCPRCKAPFTEEKCRYIFEFLLQKFFPKDRRTLNGLELDGYCKELKLAFEYQGIQHYKSIDFFHSRTNSLEKQQARDELKKNECRKRRIRLIQISYEIQDNKLLKFITEELKNLKIPLVRNPNKINFSGFVKNISKLKILNDLVKSKNGKCLSSEYSGNDTPHLWECKEGHTWKATPHAIKAGRWCPKCAGLKRGSLEEMHSIAKKRNGKCLSTAYINFTTHLLWECEKGHQFYAIPANIKNQESWCAKCAGKEKLTIEEMKELAKSKGGECLSDKYINNSTKLLWRCYFGHEWEAMPQHIKNKGSWCPVCFGRKVSGQPKFRFNSEALNFVRTTRLG